MRSKTEVPRSSSKQFGTEDLLEEALSMIHDIRKLRWKMRMPRHLTDISVEANECKKVVNNMLKPRLMKKFLK